MLKKLSTLVLILALFVTPRATAAAESDSQRVARQFREYAMHEATDRGERLLDDVDLPKTSVASVTKLLDSLRADGSWADIDYNSDARSSWRPYDHLTRVLSLTVHADRPETSPKDVAAALDGVHRALAFWIQRDFQCPNWWYNEIGTPKILGNTAILLGDGLRPDERKYIVDVVLPRSKVGTMTGQNRVWLAANGLMRGVLTDDDAAIAKAAAVIHDEIRVTTDEGIQPDFSFHQHGPQQQFGNYGLAFAVEMSRWATVLRDTRFALPADKLQLVRNYLLSGQDWVVWRGSMDISSCGRQLYTNSPRVKAGAIAGVMRTMAVVDPAHGDEYTAFVNRNRTAAASDGNDLIGNRYFWRSDYLLHRRPQMMVSLKMSSTRVLGGETVNSENLSGLHLADGATLFYQSGHEYDDIFPVWNWRQIPGVTCGQGAESLRWPARKDRPPMTDFVGAVSDGNRAVAAMDFSRSGVRAHKAWIFVDDVIVCLGAGISSSEASPVVTTINQCLLHGDVQVNDSQSTSRIDRGRRELTSTRWVEHDGLRYCFPTADQKLSINAGERTGNWKVVFDSPATPKKDVAKDVFTLLLNHGEHPTTGSYAYFVLPGGEPHEGRVEILSNSADLQAVRIDGQHIGVVLWNAGSLKLNGMDVAADQPCALLLETSKSNADEIVSATVAEPTQKLHQLRLTLGGNMRDIALPQEGEAGKSVAFTLR